MVRETGRWNPTSNRFAIARARTPAAFLPYVFTHIPCKKRTVSKLHLNTVLLVRETGLENPTSNRLRDSSGKNTCGVLAIRLYAHSVQKKEPYQGFALTRFFWCEKRDLNPYSVNYTPLKRARLPVPPLSHIAELLPCNV